MVNDKTSDESMEKFALFEFLKESLDYANDKIASLEAENRRLKEELNSK